MNRNSVLRGVARLGFPGEFVGRLRWLLAAYAVIWASIIGVVGPVTHRSVVGLFIFGAGLLLIGRWIYGYRRGTYSGPPTVLEFVLLLGVGSLGGLEIVLGPLFASALARASRDRFRHVAMSVSGYAVVCIAASAFDFARGKGSPASLAIVALLAMPAFVYLLVNVLQQRQVLEERLAYLALHDSLTGLPNRALIAQRVSEMLVVPRPENEGVAALYLDLDGFKDVNDSLGHGIGDQLLTEIATRMSDALRAPSTLGRLGGDEFVVLLDGVASLADAEGVARRLLEACRRPMTLEDHTLAVSTSIGIAFGRRQTGSDLLRDADLALYQAKGRGRDRVVVYDASMRVESEDRLSLVVDLRDALLRQQFFLAYQPIVDLKSGVITGVEALLRWRHPTRGTLEASQFISILERTPAMVEVGRWVLTEACAQAARWRQLGHLVAMAVNVSARQLDGDFATDVLRALAETGVPASTLTLELTESSVLGDDTRVLAQLHSLRGLGVRLAVDDLGTGYNTFLQLRRLPVDQIKIDRLFLADVATSTGSAALVATLLELGRRLGVETVAEGIEHAEQLDWLEDRCDSGQGYHFSRPVEAEVLTDLLAQAQLDRQGRSTPA